VLQILSIATILLCFWFLIIRFRRREASRNRQPLGSHYYTNYYKRILRDPEEQYIEGVGYIIGDDTCQYNARSPHMRCAVNPSGLCEGCRDYHGHSQQRYC
jgi:Family of unknown function (DUF6464)